MLRRVAYRRQRHRRRRNNNRRQRVYGQQQQRNIATGQQQRRPRRSIWPVLAFGAAGCFAYWAYTNFPTTVNIQVAWPTTDDEEDSTVLDDLNNGKLTEQVKDLLEDISECSRDTMTRDVVKVAKKYGIDKNNVWQFVNAVKTVTSHLLPKPFSPSTRSDLQAAKALIVAAIMIAENMTDVTAAKPILQMLSLEFLLQRVGKLLSEPELEKFALAPVLGQLQDIFDHPAYYNLDEPRNRALVLGGVEQLLLSLKNPLQKKKLLKQAIMATNEDISDGNKKHRGKKKAEKTADTKESTGIFSASSELLNYVVSDNNEEKESDKQKLAKAEKELKAVTDNIQSMRTYLMRRLLDLFSKRKEGKEALQFFEDVEKETRVPRVILFEARLINMRIAQSERNWNDVYAQASKAFDLVNVVEAERPVSNSPTILETSHDPLNLVPELLDTLLRLGQYQEAIAVGEELLSMIERRLTEFIFRFTGDDDMTKNHLDYTVRCAETYSKIAFCHYLSGAREQALINCQNTLDVLAELEESKYRSLQVDLVLLVDNLASKDYNAATDRLQNIIAIPEMEPRAIELAKSALNLVEMAKLADRNSTEAEPQLYKHIVPEVVNQLPRFTFEEGIIYGDIANSSCDRQTTLGVFWALLHSDQVRRLSPHEYRILQNRIMQTVENNQDGMEWLETYVKPLVPSEFYQDFEAELSLKKMTV